MFTTLKIQDYNIDEVTPDDVFNLIEIVSDESFMKYLPELYELLKDKSGIYQMLNSFSIFRKEEKGYLWAIRKGRHLIGFIGLMDMPSMPSIFYALHPFHRGNGVMKICLKAIIDYISKNDICEYIQTEVYKSNSPSLKCLSSCGFIPREYTEDKVIMTRTFDKCE